MVMVSLVETALTWKATYWLRSPLIRLLPSGKLRFG